MARVISNTLLLLGIVQQSFGYLIIPEDYQYQGNVVEDVDNNSPISCVLGKCGKQLIACETDDICKTWSDCNQKCGLDETALECQIRCGDLYKPTDDTAVKIDDFSVCTISQHHCVPAMKFDYEETNFTQNEFDYNHFMPGTWYITKGLNKLFDCFDCQIHHFTVDEKKEKPLIGDLNYQVKMDLNCDSRNEKCEYLHREVHQSFVQDVEKKGIFHNHDNSIEELHYSDDWYVIASKVDVYVLIYYIGNNDAVMGYHGAFLYTRSNDINTLTDEEIHDIKDGIAKTGISDLDFDTMCLPSYKSCPDYVKHEDINYIHHLRTATA